MPESSPVFVAVGEGAVVLRAPSFVPVPAGRVIDVLAPSVVAVMEES